MQDQEAIDLLEEAKEHLSQYIPTSGHNPLNWAGQKIDQALTLLRSQPSGKPKEGEISKELRKLANRPLTDLQLKRWRTKSLEAATLLDAKDAELKAKDEERDEFKNQLNPIREWYGGGTEGDRPDIKILTDAIVDLQNDRKELLIAKADSKAKDEECEKYETLYETATAALNSQIEECEKLKGNLFHIKDVLKAAIARPDEIAVGWETLLLGFVDEQVLKG